jgi:hypothetical protein
VPEAGDACESKATTASELHQTILKQLNREVCAMNENVKLNLMAFGFIALLFAFAIPSRAQSGPQTDKNSNAGQKSTDRDHPKESTSSQLGHGGKEIGRGVALGSADLGQGVAGGAGNLATGHPIDAGSSVAKGTVGFGKHAGVGAAKGTFKIGKGIGGLFKKLLRKS